MPADETRIPSAFRDALDEPVRDSGSEPPLILQAAVMLLGITLMWMLTLTVWAIVFTITMVWAPQWGQGLADKAERWVLFAIAASWAIGSLRQRLGWPWKWWLS